MKEVIPIVIQCVVEEGEEHAGHSHCTFATFEQTSEGVYAVKPLKQKQMVDGVYYLLQEIYGIENKNGTEQNQKVRIWYLWLGFYFFIFFIIEYLFKSNCCHPVKICNLLQSSKQVLGTLKHPFEQIMSRCDLDFVRVKGVTIFFITLLSPSVHVETCWQAARGIGSSQHCTCS